VGDRPIDSQSPSGLSCRHTPRWYDPRSGATSGRSGTFLRSGSGRLCWGGDCRGEAASTIRLRHPEKVRLISHGTDDARQRADLVLACCPLRCGHLDPFVICQSASITRLNAGWLRFFTFTRLAVPAAASRPATRPKTAWWNRRGHGLQSAEGFHVEKVSITQVTARISGHVRSAGGLNLRGHNVPLDR
jgi:hypothetical protein